VEMSLHAADGTYNSFADHYVMQPNSQLVSWHPVDPVSGHLGVTVNGNGLMLTSTDPLDKGARVRVTFHPGEGTFADMELSPEGA